MKANINNASQSQVNKVCAGVMFLVYIIITGFFMLHVLDFTVLYK